MTNSHRTDEELLELLRTSLDKTNPPPNNIREVADWAFSWRTMEGELAQLLHDSAIEPAGVRSPGGVRTISFELNGEVRLDMRIDTERDRIVGQVEPAVEGSAELLHRDGVEAVEIDEFGIFVFEAIEPGPVSVRVAIGDKTIRTEWFLP